MDVVKATQSYERWLGKHVALVTGDIDDKHSDMHKDAFSFLRATYYRWIELWHEHCSELHDAPRVLSVGDLHIENFGAWRDGEGRLAWGIDDFDEAGPAPYANDLVRLAASVLVAVDEGSLSVNGKKACAAILEGYSSAIGAETATPFVLEESHTHLRDLAMSDNRAPHKFWKKISKAKPVTPPHEVTKLLTAHLPEVVSDVIHIRRTVGTGGLGLPRFVAWGSCDGGFLAREAKARAPATQTWANKGEAKVAPYEAILRRAVRPADPFLHVTPVWIVRRIGPHCDRIELSAIKDAKAQREVLRAMGHETANVHWPDRGAAKKIVKDLSRRKQSWLHHHASRMAEVTIKDWKDWRKA